MFSRVALSRFSPKLATFAACSCYLVLASAEEFVDKWWTGQVPQHPRRTEPYKFRRIREVIILSDRLRAGAVVTKW